MNEEWMGEVESKIRKSSEIPNQQKPYNHLAQSSHFIDEKAGPGAGFAYGSAEHWDDKPDFLASGNIQNWLTIVKTDFFFLIFKF